MASGEFECVAATKQRHAHLLVVILRIASDEHSATQSNNKHSHNYFQKKSCAFLPTPLSINCSGEVNDMVENGIYEPFAVKIQTIKTAIESASMILRVDDIVSGSKRQ